MSARHLRGRNAPPPPAGPGDRRPGLAVVAGLVLMAGVLVLMLRGSMGEIGGGHLAAVVAMVDRVLALGCVLVVTASSVGWGLGLLRLLRLRPASAVKQVVYGSGLGLGLFGLLTLGLGAVGLVQAGWLAWAIVLAGLAWLVGLGRRLPRGLAREFVDDLLPVLRHPAALVVLGCACIALCCVLVELFAPVVAYDVVEYHLGGPAEYYRSGHVGFIEYNVYTNFPFQVEMLYLQAMSLRGDVWLGAWTARGVNLALYGLAVLATWSMTRRYVGRTYAVFAAATLASLPWVVSLAKVCYNEVGLLLYAILTLFALCDWLRESRKRSILLAGLFGGLAMGCKYPAGFLLVGVVAGLVLAGLVGRMRIGLKRTALAVALFAAGWAITFGPWMVKNTVLTGNPLYPQFYSLFGGRAWSDEQAERWQRAHTPKLSAMPEHTRPTGVDPTSARALYGPEAFRVYVLGLLTTGRVPPYELPFSPMPLLALAPLAVLAAWRSRRVRLYLITGIVGLASWFLLTHRIGRFMVPYIPVAILLGCEGMKVLEVGLKRGWIGRLVAATGVLVCTAWV
ncbi:MAG: ArnT family glycosyltransferase, partial [Planctomycetota bacterium]